MEEKNRTTALETKTQAKLYCSFWEVQTNQARTWQQPEHFTATSPLPSRHCEYLPPPLFWPQTNILRLLVSCVFTLMNNSFKLSIKASPDPSVRLIFNTHKPQCGSDKCWKSICTNSWWNRSPTWACGDFTLMRLIFITDSINSKLRKWSNIVTWFWPLHDLQSHEDVCLYDFICIEGMSPFQP